MNRGLMLRPRGAAVTPGPICTNPFLVQKQAIPGFKKSPARPRWFE
jgi:hypothetical protein